MLWRGKKLRLMIMLKMKLMKNLMLILKSRMKPRITLKTKRK